MKGGYSQLTTDTTRVSALLILEMPKSEGKSDFLMETIDIAYSYFIAERSEMLVP